MRFGLFAPMEAMVPETPPTNAPDAWYRYALDTTSAADQAGFFITLVAQRLIGPNLEAFVQSAALAAVTKNIRVMAAVHPIFWSPQVAAKMSASIDLISGGRFDFNLVTGWFDEEQRKYGGATLGGTQYARSEEFVTICRRLWRGETVSFHGRFYDMDDVSLNLDVIRQPEIYTTTRHSEESVNMSARIGDWWFAVNGDDFRQLDENLDMIKRSVEDMRERAARFGRAVRFAALGFLIQNEDEQAAIRRAEEIEDYAYHGAPNEIEQRQRTNRCRGLGTGLIGSRSRILDRLAQLEEVGIEMVLLRMWPLIPTINYLGEYIIPEASRTSPLPSLSAAR